MGAKITIYNNGPAAVEETDDAGVTVVYDDKTEVKQGASICRCGKSNNMPFCDGRHKPQPLI